MSTEKDIHVFKAAIADFEHINSLVQKMNKEKITIEKAVALVNGYNLNKNDKCFDINIGYINTTIKLTNDGFLADNNSIEVYNKNEEWLGIFSMKDIEEKVKEYDIKTPSFANMIFNAKEVSSNSSDKKIKDIEKSIPEPKEER